MRLSNEAVVALARTIGIDAVEIDRRKAFLGFDETDVRLLTDLRARWPGAARFVDNFYERLVSTGEFRDFIPDTASLERLKLAQAAYFDTLTAGDYGDDYVISRLRVGTTHRRVGLDPKWYLGAYSQYLIGLLPELWELLGDDPPRFIATCSALQKVVFLDMGLAFDTYVQADRRAILGLRRYAGDIIASLPNGLAVVDADLVVLTANDAFCTMFGLPSGTEIEGRDLGAIVPLAGIRDQAIAILDGRATSRSLAGALGGKWLRVTVTGIRLAEEEEEEEERLLVVAEDVTEQQTHAARVEQLAFHDSLTGLPNRAVFMDRLQEALIAAERHGESFAVLYMDLDRFKEINDTQGHIVGNQVLVEIALRFRGALRVDEMVARLGGDEFALIAQKADRTAAMHIAGRLVKLLNEPLSAVEGALSVGISIGIAAFPEDGRTADDLYKRADVAMYRAKATGGGYRFYQPEMSAGLDTRIKLARSLARAIDGQELQLYYQPQLDLNTGAVIGAEALLRWHDAEHGWVSPAEFIPIAEERGMMGELGTWVIQAACDQMKRWRQAGLHLTGRLAFNLSAQQLEDTGIARKILSIVEAAGLKPAEFEIELTESGLMKNVDESIRIMESLKHAGFTFALDDFGSGYSSLTYLQRLPVDRLKIDISFVRELLAGNRQRTIVSIIIGMARALGIQALAEGVETFEQVEALRELGCTEVQGYYFGRPVRADVFAEKWLQVRDDVPLL